MRDYINRNIRIDGRLIPYPVYTSWEYFELHDGIEDVEDFVDSNPAIEELVTQILALKQSCFLLRHTTHSCQSLSLLKSSKRNIIIILMMHGWKIS